MLLGKKKGELRGCIGTFAPGLLSKVLPEYAITAGIKDPRFPPIKMDELKDLSVGVSLLVNFTQVKTINSIETNKNNYLYNW